MTNRELAAALRLCGRVSGLAGCEKCPFYEGADPALCIPKMTAACADALANHENHVLALQKEIEKLRKQVEIVQAERDAVHKYTMKLMTGCKPRWVSVKERLPELIPCNAGTAYSEAVILLTSGKKVLTAIYDGDGFISDAEFWDAVEEDVTHWAPVPMPLPSTEGVE